MKDRHKACDLCSVVYMIRSVSRRRKNRRPIVCSDSYGNERTADQVMYQRNTLGSKLQSTVRKQKIVVNQSRPVRNLYKKILAYAVVYFFTVSEIKGQTVVMKNISCDPCSLRLPVQPDSSGAVVDVVPTDDHIDGCMHLDSTDLCTGQILLVVDVMNMIILNNGKNSSQMSNNTSLSAVMDVTSADNVGTDMLPVPALIGSLADAVTFCLGAVLIFPFQPFVVILWLEIFSKRDTAAFGFINLTVLNDPAFGPVRATIPSW